MNGISFFVPIFADDNVETTPMQVGRKSNVTWVVFRLKCNFLILIKTMAKAGFWLRGATGKLAGSALQKGADGSTIIREIVQPTNPKTENQKIQRIIMTTVMQAYSQMKAITDHSFEGVTAGAATMSMFMKYNLNMLRQKVATGVEQGEDIETMYHFCPTGAKIFAPNDYIISQGTLPGIGVVYSSNIPGAAVASAFAGIELPQNTYRSLIDAYGLRRGDQITLISVQGNNQAQTKFYFARIILDPTNADGTQASLDSPLVADGAINLPSPRNEGEFAGLIYGNGKLFYSFVTNQSVSTAGVIVSRKSDNGKWLRSACTLKMREDTILIDGFSLGYCLSNFNATEIGTLSNRMLNNAGTGHVVEDSGSTKTIIMFTETPHPDDPAPVRDTRHVIVRTYMKDGLLIAVDDNGKECVVMCKDAASAGYGKFYKTLDTMCNKALIVANWTGFPADADTDEKKNNWLEANYFTPVESTYYEGGRPMPESEENRIRAEEMDAAIDWGFGMQVIAFGTPVVTEW